MAVTTRFRNNDTSDPVGFEGLAADAKPNPTDWPRFSGIAYFRETDSQKIFTWGGASWYSPVWQTVAAGGGSWTTKVKTADQTNNTSTLQDDTVLQFNTEANTQYVIRLVAFLLTNATAESKYRLVHTGTTTRVRRRVRRTSTTDIAQIFELKTAFDDADVVLSTTGLNPNLEEDIILQVGASGGVVKLQFAQVTAGAGPTQCLEGSYLEYATT